MNADTYTALFIIAASLIGGACLGLRLRAERRENPYMSPWRDREPGDLGADAAKVRAMRGRR